jgi:hypothetical protein
MPDLKFKEWFVGERAKALAMVLLTRRDDLEIRETKAETGLDYNGPHQRRRGRGSRSLRNPKPVSVAGSCQGQVEMAEVMPGAHLGQLGDGFAESCLCFGSAAEEERSHAAIEEDGHTSFLSLP